MKLSTKEQIQTKREQGWKDHDLHLTFDHLFHLHAISVYIFLCHKEKW